MSCEIWSNAIFTIIGALIAGIIGILVERYRKRMEVRDKHFNDIKERCLKPTLKELNNLANSFKFSESKPPPACPDIEKLLRSPVNWWENFSFEGSLRADSLLYRDLPNHFKDLANSLENVKVSFRRVYPQFLQAILNLSKRIEDDLEFRAFNERFIGAIVDRTSLYPFYAFFFLSLGIDKGEWPNIFEFLSEHRDLLEKLGNKFYETQEAKEVRDIQKEMSEKINLCRRKIEEILYSAKLSGKCKYTEI